MGLSPALLPARTGLSGALLDSTLKALIGSGRVLELGPLMIREAAVDLERLILRSLQLLHAGAPLASGVPIETLHTSIPRLARLDGRVFASLIAGLAAAGAVVVEADLIRHSDFSAQAEESQRSDLIDRIARTLEQAALGPPSPRDLAGSDDQEAVIEALAILVRRGQVLRVKADLFFWRAAVDDLRDRLRAFLVSHEQITAQEWKALVGATRKYAIPLAEHFDAEKVTLRVGQVRRLRAIPGAARPAPRPG